MLSTSLRNEPGVFVRELVHRDDPAFCTALSTAGRPRGAPATVVTVPRGAHGMHEPIKTIESRTSWIVATMVLVILALSFGAPWITVVALKSIAAESGGLRSVPALATALAWVGFGTGGIVMGAIAERV